MGEEHPIMTASEVAALFRVDPKTVTRWAQAGRLPSFRTPGGHRRYERTKIEAIRDRTAVPLRRRADW